MGIVMVSASLYLTVSETCVHVFWVLTVFVVVVVVFCVGEIQYGWIERYKHLLL